jgi:hypothetical protein
MARRLCLRRRGERGPSARRVPPSSLGTSTAALAELCGTDAWRDGEPERDTVERIVDSARDALLVSFGIDQDALGAFESDADVRRYGDR